MMVSNHSLVARGMLVGGALGLGAAYAHLKPVSGKPGEHHGFYPRVLTTVGLIAAGAGLLLLKGRARSEGSYQAMYVAGSALAMAGSGYIVGTELKGKGS